MAASLGVMFRCDRRPEDLVPFARSMEAAGAQELWLVEDCFFAGAMASAATALAATQHITVGVGIVPAVVRNAAFTAMEFATLARLHPGRVHAGIGHGVGDWMRQIGAFPQSQIAALEEVTHAVRTLLAGQSVTMSGSYVHLDAVELNHPPDVVPPVSLGVRGPKSLAVAGRLGDGTILAEASSAMYVRAARGLIAAIRPHRMTVFAWAAPSMDEAAQAVGAVMSDPRNDAHWQPLGIGRDVADWRDAGCRIDAMPAKWVTDHAVVGTDRTLLDELAEAGADAVVLVPRGYDDGQMAQLLGDLTA